MEIRRKGGFTLIELVLVIGIIAIIAVVAIGKFSDIRKEAQRRTNIANIKNITRTINTKLAMEEGEQHYGMFAYCESLIDCADGGGVPTGTAGQYRWSDAWYDGQGGVVPGIYCGVKQSTAVANAAGVSSGSFSL